MSSKLLYKELSDKTIEKALPYLNAGDFLFYLPTQRLDFIITEYSGWACHCGLYLGDGLTISARPKKGVDFDMLAAYKKPFKVFSIKDITSSETDKLIELALLLRGAKYDKLHFPFIPFNKAFSSSKKYVCSEYLAVCSIRIGRIPNKDPEILSPTELANQDWMIYEREVRE